MNLKLGEKIRDLRKKQNRTQENIADALGVTGQAVSRWEQGLSYPDMELVPSIANYFGITIDELFGYENDRERKISSIIAKVDELDAENLRNDVNLNECLAILREGLAEFPGNERITHRLAHILSETGWRRHREWMHYDEEGYIRYDFDKHRKNEYWDEAIKLFEHLVSEAGNEEIRTDSICNLIMLYRNIGQTEQAISMANRLPKLDQSREIMLATATYGKQQAKYLGEALLSMAYQFAEQLVYALVNNEKYYETDMPIRKIHGVIDIFKLLCDDGNLGFYHRETAYLELYLSRLEWEAGKHDEAFTTLYDALENAKAYDILSLSDHPQYTAPLVKFADCPRELFIEHGTLAENLPTDWPMWCNPDYSDVKAEITADPRWDAWVERCRASNNG